MARPNNYNFPKIKFCKYGHAIIGDNMIHDRNLVAVRCKRCMSESAKRWRQNGNMRPATVNRIKELVRDGATLSSLSGYSKGSVATLSPKRLRLWCEANPKEGKPLWKLLKQNAQAAIERNRVRNIITAPSIIRSADDIMDVISAAVPRHLPKDHRDDVIQNIWMAVLERRLKRSEIAARASGFVRAEYRNAHNAWGDRSLDVPIWIDSATTLLDTLSTEQRMWGP